MSKRETKRLQQKLRQQQTENSRRLRNESLKLGVELARDRGEPNDAFHYEMMIIQWQLIDDGHDYLEAELNRLSRDYRTRSILSGVLAAIGFLLLGPQIVEWLFG